MIDPSATGKILQSLGVFDGTDSGNQRRWSTVLKSIVDAVITTDRNGKVDFVNPSAEVLLGLGSRECRGKQIREIIELRNEETGELINCCEQLATESGAEAEHSFAALMVRRDGTSIPIDGTVAVIGSSAESAPNKQSVWVLRDISKRKQTEVFLRESEESFTRLADSTADVIILVNADKKITFWNHAASTLSGYRPGDVLGKELSEFVRFRRAKEGTGESHDSDSQIGYFNYLESISQLEISTTYGELIPVEASLSSLQLRGKWFTVMICRDVRERKRAEIEINKYRLQLEELVQERTQELLETNRQLKNEIAQRINEEEQRRKLEERVRQAEKMESLGILAGGVAHDLNNLLSPLLGYPQLIRSMMPMDSKVEQMIEQIENAAEDAVAIVDDLHTLSRRGRCVLRPTQLNDVVSRFLKSSIYERLQRRKPGISVELKLDDNLPQISGSSPHLIKVVMNLVVNAFDAMSEDGSLTIATATTELLKLRNGYENITPGKYVLLRVTDTGEGISEEKLKRIFEPYFSTKQMNESGTGLGLAIVYGVVKDHHGYYDVISEVGVGTEFIIYFPILSEADGAPTEANQPENR